VARLERVAGGMAHPVAMSAFPDAHGRLAVVDQTGQVWIVDDNRRLPTPFLDVQPQMVELEDSYDERGLLGMAFHPDYAQNGRFFVWYSVPLRDGAPDDWNHTNRLSEFRVSEGDPMRADASSERVLLEIDHPYMNHNAGQLTFGPDGMLYVGVGDGGNRDDEGRGHVNDWYKRNAGGNGQDVTQNLMGSILRLDVDRQDPGKAYAVPRDNPFASGGAMAGQGLPEIWAYGLRNPWRMSWDRAGEMGLIAGDVGQELYDEVSVITAGGNYGWNVYEAAHCFDANQPKRPPRDCPAADPMGNRMQMPIIEAGNASAFRDAHGLALVGGYVYRGRALPALRGRYVFGNWSRGRTPGHSHSGGGHSGSGSEDDGHMGGYVTLAVPRQGGLWGYIGLPLEGAPSGEIEPFVLGFGEDASGELYVLTTEARGPHGDSGTVWRLAPVD
jgi:glucose/arabinose dehydrogenase